MVCAREFHTCKTKIHAFVLYARVHPAGRKKTTVLPATAAAALAKEFKHSFKAGPIPENRFHTGKAFGIGIEIGTQQFHDSLAVFANIALFKSQAFSAIEAARRDDFG